MTPLTTGGLVRKLWHYCNVLRDDGLSYPDYVEQLTYLLFLKMADERVDGVSADPGWSSFASLPPQAMKEEYGRVLGELGTRAGTLGMIFGEARNKISDPEKLHYLVVDLVGQINWRGLSADVKGDAYEGLLEKNARDTKSGAGQYFTPRPLVEAIVSCVHPLPGEVICDPACGTGGFLLAARDHLAPLALGDADAEQHLRTTALRGVELVQEVARLATMNLYLHGVTGDAEEVPVRCEDSLRFSAPESVDIVLSNPPFGVKGSVTYATGAERRGSLRERTEIRDDFWAKSANKQLNFLQHIATTLRPSGRAAVVVPDNVLFESGAAASIRRRLLERSDVHTLLRLPAGIFYATGVLANVLFFDATPGEKSRRQLWVYDLRTDNRYSLKGRPLSRSDLEEFVRLYRPGDVHARPVSELSRWRAFEHDDLLADESRLDLSWELVSSQIARELSGLEQVDAIGMRIQADLSRALSHFSNIVGGEG